MYKAIVFDLDGTLLNTIIDIRDSMNRALTAVGLPTHDAESYCYFVGSGVKILAERAVGESHQELADDVAALYQADYEKNNANKTCPYAGIMDMLKDLNTMDVPIAILSNKPHEDTLNVVKHYFPEIKFTVVRGQVAGVPVKPDPAGAVEILKALAISPEECLYAGDTIIDMTCANAARMNAVGVTWGFRKRDELERGNAKYIVDAPSEIVALMKEHRV